MTAAVQEHGALAGFELAYGACPPRTPTPLPTGTSSPAADFRGQRRDDRPRDIRAIQGLYVDAARRAAPPAST